MKRKQFVFQTMVGVPLYIAPCLNGQTCVTYELNEAEKFDERDNMAMKARFFKATTGMDFTSVAINEGEYHD